MSHKPKYYVVWKGHIPGIYTTWEDCLKQVKNFPNAKYKSFSSHDEATMAFDLGIYNTKSKAQNNITTFKKNSAIVCESISVDAACSGNPGKLEYQGVMTCTKQQLFHVGPLEEGTNNIGEFLALVHGLAYLKKLGKDHYPIYTDSKTARSWVRNKKVKTTLKSSSKNMELFSLMERAQKWLNENSYNNPILTWDTKKWGEIPADFNRK